MLSNLFVCTSRCHSWKAGEGSSSACCRTVMSWSSSRGLTLAPAHHLLKSYSHISRKQSPPASAAHPCARHELEEAGSKGEMLSRRPILGKARDTPSPKIEEGPCQATPQAAPPRGKELTHDYNTCMFPLQWDQFMATRDGPTRMTSDQGSHQGEARDSWRRP